MGLIQFLINMVSEPEFSTMENPFASASNSMASPAHSSSSSSANEDEQLLPPAPATVIQTINIHSHVLVVLDLAESNYSQWRSLFESTLGKFGLTSHVLSAALITNHDAEWARLDHTVVNWIYTTISKTVFDIVYQPCASAFIVWSDVEGFFRGNELQRAVLLEAEFRNLHQGDMSMTDYTTKLKKLADGFRDVGQPVSESSQVPNMLRGLNPKYRYLKPVIVSKSPPHAFHTTRSFLLLEELTADNDAKMDVGHSVGHSAGNSSASSDSGTSGSHSKPCTQKKCEKGGGGGSDVGGSSGADGGSGTSFGFRSADNTSNLQLSWAASYNPWTGLVQAWPMSFWALGAGALGPRPPVYA